MLLKNISFGFVQIIEEFCVLFQRTRKLEYYYKRRAVCYTEMKFYDQAISDLNEAIQISPDSFKEIGFLMIRALVHTERLEKALEGNISALSS